jgi:hypothetical protein
MAASAAGSGGVGPRSGKRGSQRAADDVSVRGAFDPHRHRANTFLEHQVAVGMPVDASTNAVSSGRVPGERQFAAGVKIRTRLV